MAAERDRLAAANLAERQYSNALKLITPLDKDYRRYVDDIKRVAYKCDWHASICDNTVLYPEEPTAKEKIDRKNAYLLITVTTKDSAVYELMRTAVPLGDPQAAMDVLGNYFHRRMAGGRGAATAAFYSSTMISHPHLNLEAFITHIAHGAADLNQIGTPCDDMAQFTQLCAGLLPEFQPIRMKISDLDLTIVEARAKLIDHAKTYGLQNLTKAGPSTNNNSFSADDAEEHPACRLRRSHNQQEAVCTGRRRLPPVREIGHVWLQPLQIQPPSQGTRLEAGC